MLHKVGKCRTQDGKMSHIGWKNAVYMLGQCLIKGEQVSHIEWANIGKSPYKVRKYRILRQQLSHIGEKMSHIG